MNNNESILNIRKNKYEAFKQWFDDILTTYPTLMLKDEEFKSLKEYRLYLFDLMAQSSIIFIKMDKYANKTPKKDTPDGIITF